MLEDVTETWAMFTQSEIDAAVRLTVINAPRNTRGQEQNLVLSITWHYNIIICGHPLEKTVILPMGGLGISWRAFIGLIWQLMVSMDCIPISNEIRTALFSMVLSVECFCIH